MPEPKSPRSPWLLHLTTLIWMGAMWVLLTLSGDSLAPVGRALPDWLPSWSDKPAHMLLFVILGWLLQGSLTVHLRWGVGALLAIAVGCIYGALTEWWQLSVPGRSAEWGDVLFNSLGTVLGVALRR